MKKRFPASRSAPPPTDAPPPLPLPAQPVPHPRVPSTDQLGDIHRYAAAEQARQIGLDPDGPGSWTHPHPTRSLYGDGKVITPLYRAHPGDAKLDKATGELKPLKAEPDAGLHWEGTGETAWGTKFVCSPPAGRMSAPGSSSTPRLRASAGRRSRRGHDVSRRTAPHTPGAQAVVYDTAAWHPPPDRPPQPRTHPRKPGHRRQGRVEEEASQPAEQRQREDHVWSRPRAPRVPS